MVWGKLGTSGIWTMGGDTSADLSFGAAIIAPPHASALRKKLRRLLI
jgi:hypothetical protein